MKKGKRLALLLAAVLMLVGAFGVTAFADTTVATREGKEYSSLQDAINDARSNDTITIVANTNETQITINKSLFINLNGCTVTESNIMNITSGTTTIYDSSNNNGGKIVFNHNYDNGDLCVHGDKAKLVFESGTMVAGVADASVLYVYGNGSADINGGRISATNGVTAYASNNGVITVNGGTINSKKDAALSSSEDGIVIVNGGEINSEEGYGLAAYNYYGPGKGSKITVNGGNISGGLGGVRAYYGAEATIKDGTINGGTYGVYVGGASGSIEGHEGSVHISGGTISGTSYGLYVYGGSADVTGDEVIINGSVGCRQGSTINLKGGTYSSDVSAYIDKDYIEAKNEEGKYLVKDPDDKDLYTVKDKDENILYYTSETAAIKDGAVVTLTFNANNGTNEKTTQIVPKGNTVTLNKNTFTNKGFKFKGWATKKNPSDSDRVYDDESSLKIEGNATLYAVWEKHEHEWVVVQDETDKSTAILKCKGTDCQYHEGIKFVLTAEDVTYNGEVQKADAKVTADYFDDDTLITYTNVFYDYDGQSNPNYDGVTDAGSHTAYVNVKINNEFKVGLEKDFEIAPAELKVNLPVIEQTLEYTGTGQGFIAEPGVVKDNEDIAFAYAVVGEEDKDADPDNSKYLWDYSDKRNDKTEKGTYYVKYKLFYKSNSKQIDSKNYTVLAGKHGRYMDELSFPVTEKAEIVTADNSVAGPTVKDWTYLDDGAPFKPSVSKEDAVFGNPYIMWKAADAPDKDWEKWVDAGGEEASYPVDAGEYVVKAVVDADESKNYSAAESNEVPLTISPFKVKVVADRQAKYEGETDPVLTYSVTDLDGKEVKDSNRDEGSQTITSDEFNGSLYRESGQNPGTYEIYGFGELESKSGNFIVTHCDTNLLTIRATGDEPTDLKLAYTGEEQKIVDSNPVDKGTTYVFGLANEEGNEPEYEEAQVGKIPTVKDVGEYVYYYRLADNATKKVIGKSAGKITITVSPAILTIIPNEDQQKTYGDDDAKLTYSISGLLGDDESKTAKEMLGGSLKRTTGENVGSYSYDISGLWVRKKPNGKRNYTLVLAEGYSFEITPKEVTIEGKAATKVYGEKDPAFTYRATLLKNQLVDKDSIDDNFDITVTRRGSGFDAEYVGEHALKVTVTVKTPEGTANPNYTAKTVDGTLTITKRPIKVSVTDATKTYGDADPAFDYEVTGVDGNDKSGLVNTDTKESSTYIDGALTREKGEDVKDGGYTIYADNIKVKTVKNRHKVDVENYVIVEQRQNGILLIGKRTITITPKDVTVTQGTDPATIKDNGVSYDNLAERDKTEAGELKEGVFTGTISYVFKDKDGTVYTANSPAGKGTVEVDNNSTYESGNYTITWGKGVFTVNEKTPSGGGGGSVTDPVDEVIKMIKALDPTASDYAAKAQAAVDAYNALTDAQKADPKFKEQEVATKLADAQAAVASEADKKAADEASTLIVKLPDDPSQASEADAQAAWAAYNALTDAQKALLSADAQKKVAEYKYYYEVQGAKAQTVKLKSVKAKKGRKAVAKWSKNADVDGYQLYYKAKGQKAKKVTIKSAKTLKKTVKKLKAGKKYTFKVRTFTKVYNPSTGENQKIYGKWSNKKTCKAKK